MLIAAVEIAGSMDVALECVEQAVRCRLVQIHIARLLHRVYCLDEQLVHALAAIRRRLADDRVAMLVLDAVGARVEQHLHQGGVAAGRRVEQGGAAPVTALIDVGPASSNNLTTRFWP